MIPGERNESRNMDTIRLRPAAAEPLVRGEYGLAFNSLISQVIAKRVPCFFIQPHYDDNILSTGGLMRWLTSNVVPVRSITMMSDAPNINSGSDHVKTVLTEKGVEGPREYIEQRRVEDGRAMGHVGIGHSDQETFGAMDAIFRESSDSAAESTRQIIKGARNAVDEALVTTLSGRVTERMQNVDGPMVVFVPVGIGKHKDHLIVRDAVIEALESDPRVKLVFYKDIPYALKSTHLEDTDHAAFLREHHLGLATYEGFQDERISGIYEYASEIRGLFANRQAASGGIVALPHEGYYLSLDSLPSQ